MENKSRRLDACVDDGCSITRQYTYVHVIRIDLVFFLAVDRVILATYPPFQCNSKGSALYKGRLGLTINGTRCGEGLTCSVMFFVALWDHRSPPRFLGAVTAIPNLL